MWRFTFVPTTDFQNGIVEFQPAAEPQYNILRMSFTLEVVRLFWAFKSLKSVQLAAATSGVPELMSAGTKPYAR